MGRTVAVTGAAGNLGRLVVERLLASDSVARVIALDRKPPPRVDARVTFVRADVRDPELARHLAGVDAVLHLAFIVERGSRDAVLAESVNVGGTRNVAAAVVAAGVRHLVFASSVASYGFRPENTGIALTEEAPLHGDEGFYYPRHKAITDRMLGALADAHPEIAVARLRPSLFLGPRTDPARTAGLRAPVIAIPPGPPVPLQVTHEDDVADAFVLALEHEARGAFNVAANEPLTLAEIGRAVGKPTVRIPRAAIRAYELAYQRGIGEIDPAWLTAPSADHLIASSDKIRRELGWAPRFDSAGAVARAIAGRPSALASRATRLLFGSAVATTRLLGRIPVSARERAEMRGIRGVLNVALTGDHPSEWRVILDDGDVRFAAGLDPAADGTVRLEEGTLFDMLSGKVPFMRAQMTGRIRYRGDGNLVIILGAIVEQFRQARRAKGLAGVGHRNFTRFVLAQAGRADAPRAD